jgi:hypothetical protein
MQPDAGTLTRLAAKVRSQPAREAWPPETVPMVPRTPPMLTHITHPCGLLPVWQPFFRCAPASGPRSLCFHPNGRWCYLITEISSTVVPLRYDSRSGTLTALSQAVDTLPDDWQGFSTEAEGTVPVGQAPTGRKGNLTAHIEVSPDGRFVYGSNRGHDSIVCFQVDGSTGALDLVSHTPSGGRSPRAFAIHPSGCGGRCVRFVRRRFDCDFPI